MHKPRKHEVTHIYALACHIAAIILFWSSASQWWSTMQELSIIILHALISTCIAISSLYLSRIYPLRHCIRSKFFHFAVRFMPQHFFTSLFISHACLLSQIIFSFSFSLSFFFYDWLNRRNEYDQAQLTLAVAIKTGEWKQLCESLLWCLISNAKKNWKKFVEF